MRLSTASAALQREAPTCPDPPIPTPVPTSLQQPAQGLEAPRALWSVHLSVSREQHSCAVGVRQEGHRPEHLKG